MLWKPELIGSYVYMYYDSNVGINFVVLVSKNFLVPIARVAVSRLFFLTWFYCFLELQ